MLCDGMDWKGLQFETSPPPILGSSCKEIKENNPLATNGVYYIDLDFPVYCDMDDGGWTLVFKAVTGTYQRAVDIYKSDDVFNEKTLTALDVTNQFPHDYKNRIVQNWKDFGADEARVVLYAGGNSVKELIFNAQGSDKLNWFHFDRLKNDPWSDIRTQPRNFFAIDPNEFERSFFINSVYAGCPGDVGWMIIHGAYCGWEKSKPPQAILYSKRDGRVNWNENNNVGIADVLAIYLR